MKNYDFAFSLGYSCGASQALRDAGLQFASFPLDWIGSPSLMASANTIATHFDKWLLADDLELFDVRHDTGFLTRVYRNRRTGFGFSHEFSDFKNFDENYKAVSATYERRIKRLEDVLKGASNILALYLELPFRACIGVDEMNAALAMLSKSYPGKTFELLYAYEDPTCKEPRETRLSPNISTLALDYRLFDRGEITHFVNVRKLTEYLRDNIKVADYRTKDDIEQFKKFTSGNVKKRWGAASRLQAFRNKWAFKLFRHFEKYLKNRGIIHREGPLWFVEDAKGAAR